MNRFKCANHFTLDRTLAISPNKIYITYSKKNSTTNTPQKRPKRFEKGGMLSRRKIIFAKAQSFLAMESHYCRMKTNMTYLEDSIKNVAKMYDLYVEKCKESNLKALSKTCS